MPQNVVGVQISEIFISFCENHYVISSIAKKKKVCNGAHKPQAVIIPSLIYHSLISFYRSISARLLKIYNKLQSLAFLSASVFRQQKQIVAIFLFVVVLWAYCLLEYKCTFFSWGIFKKEFQCPQLIVIINIVAKQLLVGKDEPQRQVLDASSNGNCSAFISFYREHLQQAFPCARQS